MLLSVQKAKAVFPRSFRKCPALHSVGSTGWGWGAVRGPSLSPECHNAGTQSNATLAPSSSAQEAPQHGEQREGPGLTVALETGWWGASSLHEQARPFAADFLLHPSCYLCLLSRP